MQVTIRGYIRRSVLRVARFFGITKIKRRYGVYIQDADAIFKKLDAQEISYAVLRWFEDLPHLDADEDLDLLVADSDFSRIKRVLQRGKGGVKGFVQFDIYPESNLEGDIAYYPPHLASQILKTRRRLECGVWVPSPREYFLSLTYHALFHKGFNAGLRSDFPDRDIPAVKRNFSTILPVLAEEADIKIDNVSMTYLESVLKKYGWRPPLDVYFRRAKKNDWVRMQADNIVDTKWRNKRGLVVFILREVLADTYLELLLRKMLEEYEASVVEEMDLTQEDGFQLLKKTRGGDWGRPRIGKSYGGLPKKIIVAYRWQEDHDVELEGIPFGVVEYEWVLDIKKRVRAAANSGIPYKMHCHVLHTSDNGVEASHYRELFSQLKIGD